MILIRKKVRGALFKPHSGGAVKSGIGAVATRVAAAAPTATSKGGLLHFSQKIDYGFFLLVELAKNLSPVPRSLRAIAEMHRMSFFFLQKVALDLRRAGLIHANRGKNGGYTLARDAGAITMKDVLEALDGPLAIMHCLGHAPEVQTCVREGWCSVRPGLNFINQTIIESLSKTTLSDFLTTHARN